MMLRSLVADLGSKTVGERTGDATIASNIVQNVTHGTDQYVHVFG